MNAPPMQKSQMGLRTNLREMQTGVYNTIEPYDPYLGVGMLRYDMGQTIEHGQWLDVGNRNLMFQHHLPGVFPTGDDAQNGGHVVHLAAGEQQKYGTRNRRWEEEWPRSNERMANGHGKLATLPHF